MPRRRGVLVGLLLSGASLLLAACSANSSPGHPSVTSGAAAAGGAAAAPAQSSGAQSPSGNSSGEPQANLGSAPVRQVIYTATLSLERADAQPAVEQASGLARELGGFVASSDFRREQDRQLATVTLKVPASRYDEAMSRLRALGRVLDEKANSQDISEEYTDLQAQLRNFEAASAQYQEFLKRAATIDEVLRVQQRLTDTQAQIERIKGRLQLYDRQVDLATITLSLTPPATAVSGEPQANPFLDPSTAVGAAWDASTRFLRAAGGLAVTALVFGWWLSPPLAALAVLLRRRRGRPRDTPPPAPQAS